MTFFVIELENRCVLENINRNSIAGQMKFSLVILLILLRFTKQNDLEKENMAEPEDSISEVQELVLNNEELKWLAAYRPPSIAVLVHTCKGPMISRLIEQLIAYRSSKDELVIIVLQHCWHEETTSRLKEFGNKIHILQGPDITHPDSYFESAYNHYWAFRLLFEDLRFETAIVMQDYFDISSDFQAYFKSTAKLLKRDQSLWCVLGYNANGGESLIDTAEMHGLHRTDFFSGIAWMTLKLKWKEFGNREWPVVNFLDWIWDQTVTKTLACIRPEISRVKFFPDDVSIGSLQSSLFRNHPDNIYLNNISVEFNEYDLLKLEKWNYDQWFMSAVFQCQKSSLEYLKRIGSGLTIPLRITYNNEEEFKEIAAELGIRSEIIRGVPLNSYNGIVTTVYKTKRVYLVPESFV